MSKQLYAYSIAPGDEEHLSAYYFTHGVVEAEPDEIDAIVKELDTKHRGLLEVTPIADAKIDIGHFRHDVGRGLWTSHGEEVRSDTPCEEDAPCIEGCVRADYSPDQVEAVMREIYPG